MITLAPTASTGLHRRRLSRRQLLLLALPMLPAFLATGCQPSPGLNVLNYRLADSLGVYAPPPADGPTGAVTGLVLGDGVALADATVVIAEARGTPHVAHTDADGRYRIADLPPGRYRPAAHASGYAEAALQDAAGFPIILTVVADETTVAPPLELTARTVEPLPDDLAAAVALTQTDAYSATTVFPPDAAAQVLSYTYLVDGATVDTLRVYLPLDIEPDAQLPLLFFSYPGEVDGWQDLSVAFAAQGYALAALSPVAARGLDIDAHAQDARIALELALQGALTPHVDPTQPVIALGGSFTSAILYRLLLTTPGPIAAWVTLGGIANGFSGAEAFYAGELELPPSYSLAIPGLGQPNLLPLELLRYSSVYGADELPPTLIIHTAVDRISPIEQAYELAAALEQAGVPVETYYYEDVSHYLQIGEALTPEGQEMFERVFDFVERISVL